MSGIEGPGVVGGGGGGGGAPTTATYVTSGNEVATLPNSRQLVNGSGTTVNTATPGQVAIDVAGGSVSETFTDITSTTTMTGFSGTPTKDVKGLKTGRTVTLRINATGTSNSASFTFSVPTPFRPNQAQQGLCMIQDLGVNGVGFYTINTAGAMDIFANVASGGFAASGTKSLLSATIQYIGVP